MKHQSIGRVEQFVHSTEVVYFSECPLYMYMYVHVYNYVYMHKHNCKVLLYQVIPIISPESGKYNYY